MLNKNTLREILFTFLFIGILLKLRADSNIQFYYRTMVNLADYIANDYENAIQNGKVINEFEYQEMLDFSESLQSNFKEASKLYSSKKLENLPAEIALLKTSILNKKDADDIKVQAKVISKQLLAEGVLSNIPNNYPSIKNGKKVYELHCQECHGLNGKGDGERALGLDPKPANYKELTHLFPFHIYNTVELGIEGTAMESFAQLTEQEKWDVAFFVQTLTYKDQNFDVSLYPDAAAHVSIEDLSNQSNSQLEEKFKNQGFEKVKSLRFHQNLFSKNESLELTLHLLEKSIQAYDTGNIQRAKQLALDAYFLGFEPVEIVIGATDINIVATIEQEMIKFRSYLNSSGNSTALNNQLNKIRGYIDSIESNKEMGGFWFAFLYAIPILIREGLEALLIIVSLLAALTSMQSNEAKKYVHFGWISALIIGVLSFFFLNKVLDIGSQKREIIEGFGALIAVVILLTVGFWLHDKSNSQSWSEYINKKLNTSLGRNSMFSVALLSFVVVFREAFESVVFLSTLIIDGSANSKLGLFCGTIVSFLILMLLAIAIVKYFARIPISKVFQISSFTMAVLAIVLAGRGIKELQEAGVVSIHYVSNFPSIDILGIYPTIETLSIQFITLLLCVLIWQYNKRKLSS